MSTVWTHMQSSRDVRSYQSSDYHMMIIPSLQEDLWHVIMENENDGVMLNCLLTKEAILEIHGIDV